MSLFVPVWGLIALAGVGAWTFGYKLVGAGAIVAGLVIGGFINF